jgi:hypothetical protein
MKKWLFWYLTKARQMQSTESPESLEHACQIDEENHHIRAAASCQWTCSIPNSYLDYDDEPSFSTHFCRNGSSRRTVVASTSSSASRIAMRRNTAEGCSNTGIISTFVQTTFIYPPSVGCSGGMWSLLASHMTVLSETSSPLSQST